MQQTDVFYMRKDMSMNRKIENYFSSLDLYGASVREKEESDDIRHCFHLENESSGGDITLYHVFPYSICPNTSPSPAWIRRSARLSIGVVDLLISTSLCPL